MTSIHITESNQYQFRALLHCRIPLLRNLKRLDLRESLDRRLPIEISNVAKLPNLTHLYLPPLQMEELQMLLIRPSYSLSTLSLDGTKILTAQHLDILTRHHPSLTKVDLSCCPLIGDHAISYLETLTQLRVLVLDNCSLITDLSPLSQLKLEKISVYRTKVNDIGAMCLQNMTTLLKLDLEYTDTSPDLLGHLTNLTNLRILTLNQATINDDNIHHLKQFQELKELKIIKSVDLDGVSYKAIEEHTKIKRLELRSNKALRTEDWSFLSQWHFLERLEITNTPPIDDKVLEYFSGLTGLKRLIVFPSTITVIGLKHLSKCPLSRLNIRQGSGIDDAAIEFIATHFKLERLNITGCGLVTQKGLELVSAILVNRH